MAAGRGKTKVSQGVVESLQLGAHHSPKAMSKAESPDLVYRSGMALTTLAASRKWSYKVKSPLREANQTANQYGCVYTEQCPPVYSRRDRVDTLVGDRLPSVLPDLLDGSLEVLGRGLESPVRLDGLLDLSVRSC